MDDEIEQWPAEHEVDSSGLVRLQRREELRVRKPLDMEAGAQPGFRGGDDRIQDHDARDDGIAREVACQRRVLCGDAERRGMPGLCVCSHGCSFTTSPLNVTPDIRAPLPHSYSVSLETSFCL